jgi:hypothetical protein
MLDFLDLLVLAGMVLLRFGVPLLIVVGVGYFLKRLDRRWEREAWEEQMKAKAANAPAEQPSVPAPAPTRRPVAPVRMPAPGSVIPFIPPQVRDTPRPQPGVMAAQVAQPCWTAKGCSEAKKAECAAPQHPEKSCWQARFDAEGQIPEDCVNCDTFQRYPLM